MRKYYSDINILRLQTGDFSSPSSYGIVKIIKGLIQTPSNSKTFNNGKETSFVVGTLFCDIKETFEPKDIVEQHGIRYKIAGSATQPKGVTGIKPKRGQHAEYQLEYTQGGM